MAALVSSAVLTADALHPERAFCPLEQACAAARESALGSVFGVPTSVLGMLAFGGLFLLTLLPVEWSRPLLRPAGALAALAGVGFVAYQAFVLHTYCPLCLVADVAGFLAGLITLTWPQPPVRLSGRRLPGEDLPRRAAWVVAASLAVLAPFAWPRPEAASWVEIVPLATAETLFEDEKALDGEAPPSAAPPRPSAPPLMDRVALTTGTSGPTAHPAVHPIPATPFSPTPVPVPVVKPVFVVEYLNAYCQHCRATHQRFGVALDRLDHPVRVRRIYTWGGKGYPLWARACAYAETQGLEEAMFGELLKSTRESRQEIHAAARRAGVDTHGLDQALRSPAVPESLQRDAHLMRSARLQGLPTLDIGRRRLMGAQSEAELTSALRAAVHDSDVARRSHDS